MGALFFRGTPATRKARLVNRIAKRRSRGKPFNRQLLKLQNLEEQEAGPPKPPRQPGRIRTFLSSTSKATRQFFSLASSEARAARARHGRNQAVNAARYERGRSATIQERLDAAESRAAIAEQMLARRRKRTSQMIQNIQLSGAEAKKNTERLEAELKRATAEAAESKKYAESLEKTFLQMKGIIDAKNAALADIQKNIDLIERQIAGLSNRPLAGSENAGSRINYLEAQLKKAESAAARLEKEIAAREERLDTAEKSLVEATAKAAAAEARLSFMEHSAMLGTKVHEIRSAIGSLMFGRNLGTNPDRFFRAVTGVAELFASGKITYKEAMAALEKMSLAERKFIDSGGKNTVVDANNELSAILGSLGRHNHLLPK